MSIYIKGELTFNVQEMMRNTTNIKSDTVQKIKRTPVIDPVCI